jgi:hypothetical protein
VGPDLDVDQTYDAGVSALTPDRTSSRVYAVLLLLAATGLHATPAHAAADDVGAAPAFADVDDLARPPGGGPLVVPPATIGGSNGFSPTAPTRLLDTRPGRLGTLETPTGSLAADRPTPIPANTTQRFVLNGLSPTAGGIAINVTAISPPANGFVTLYVCGSESAPPPPISSLNYTASLTKGGFTTVVMVATNGLCVFSSQTLHLTLDTPGYFEGDSGLEVFGAPSRLFDSRPDKLGSLEQNGGAIGVDVTTPLNAGLAITLPVFPKPAMFNVTVVAPPAAGFAKVFPCIDESTFPPTGTAISYGGGASVGNSVMVTVNVGQVLCVLSSQTAHVVIDEVAQWVIHAINFPSARLYDSRPEVLGLMEQPGGVIGSDVTTPVDAGTAVIVVATNVGGVPGAVSGVSVNVTAINPPAAGFLKVFPCTSTADPPPDIASVNYQQGRTVANLAMAMPIGGSLCVASSQTVHIAVDLQGYFVDVFSL